MPSAALPPHVHSAVEAFLARVREHFGARLSEARVYGSFARGDAGPDSDVDVFVRVDDINHGERGLLFELAAEASLDHLVTLQVFAPSLEEYDWLDRNECRIVRDIKAEGIAL